MWELYTFWAFVPWIIFQYEKANPLPLHPFMFTFLVIASGFVSCIAGGQWAVRIGSLRVATLALMCSGMCCLLSPLIWGFSPWLFIGFMIFWGMTVVADSPQFSALVARNAPDDLRGSAITLVTCIGFSITIFSIQLLNYLQQMLPHQYLLLVLVPGPLLGVLSLKASLKKQV
jgi:MFS family permease